jgi:hypothetical protein
MMLDASPMSDGKNGLTWVMQVSQDGRTRTGRLSGAELAPSAITESALDDATARKIAAQALTNLAYFMSGGVPEQPIITAARDE